MAGENHVLYHGQSTTACEVTRMLSCLRTLLPKKIGLWFSLPFLRSSSVLLGHILSKPLKHVR